LNSSANDKKERKDFMKFCGVFIMLFIVINVSAQNKKWITEYSEDESIKVVYSIYDSLDVNGEEQTYIEYTGKTRTVATLEKCVEIFNNPGMHKKFYEYTEVSDKVKDISENEWIIYYYYSPPWPIADSDCVSRITMYADSVNKKIVFTSFSEPNLIETKGVTRSELNDITFTFTRINENETEVFIEAILVPETPAPKWMMSAWFPEGPAGTLKRFIKLAEEL
jgi:hypothetical protein